MKLRIRPCPRERLVIEHMAECLLRRLLTPHPSEEIVGWIR